MIIIIINKFSLSNKVLMKLIKKEKIIIIFKKKKRIQK